MVAIANLSLHLGTPGEMPKSNPSGARAAAILEGKQNEERQSVHPAVAAWLDVAQTSIEVLHVLQRHSRFMFTPLLFLSDMILHILRFGFLVSLYPFSSALLCFFTGWAGVNKKLLPSKSCVFIPFHFFERD